MYRFVTNPKKAPSRNPRKNCNELNRQEKNIGAKKHNQGEILPKASRRNKQQTRTSHNNLQPRRLGEDISNHHLGAWQRDTRS